MSKERRCLVAPQVGVVSNVLWEARIAGRCTAQSNIALME
jgi:hypothetical protein